jgi:putative transposase
MPRLARIVVPDYPHHITQRGNRRMKTFFADGDYQTYRELLGEHCRANSVAIWGYCLMPNHVHLILAPQSEAGLAIALSETHRRYSRAINFRQHWRGFLWQGRFASFPMDGNHVLAAAQYVEMNPVRAKLVSTPEAWPWSSAKAHLTGHSDGFCDPKPLLDLVPDWNDLLAAGIARDAADALRASERTGRPLGSEDFIETLERKTGRVIAKRKPGPKAFGVPEGKHGGHDGWGT